MNNIDVLVISIANPILVGIYKDNILLETIESKGKTSDVLPNIFKEILEKFDISTIFYVNGPGSYMAIKVGYIFLKTLSIVKGIEFKATNGFEFNENSPIKALGKKYFFNQDDGKIIIEFLKDSDKLIDFKLPKELKKNIFNDDCLPNYHLPAVY
jgi:hypothetical protein